MDSTNLSNSLKYLPFLALILLTLGACSTDSDEPEPMLQTNIQGTVKDDAGGYYDNVAVVLTNAGNQVASIITDPMGAFKFNDLDDGQYELEITPPLATTVQGANPVSISIQNGIASSAEFLLSLESVSGHIIGSDLDPFGEIKTTNRENPANPDEPLYAVNVFTDGQLNPILAPDGHQVTYSEWQQAQGEAVVSCDGKTTNFDLQFTGLIPNGVYTVWVAPLVDHKSVNSSWNPNADILGTGALGNPSGTQNKIIANELGEGGLTESMSSGALSTFGSLSSCALTSNEGMVLILDYHIDGKTYGETSGPDNTEVGHMIFLF